jgi:glycosyltransferase involved in cell wall biosynthesis
MSNPSFLPRHVLHLTSPASYGGLERVVEMLSVGSNRAGMTATVLCVLEAPNDDHAFVRRLEASGVDTVVITNPNRAYTREIEALARAIRERGADVVHTHGYRSDILGSYAARRAHRPVVSTLHGFTAMGWKAKLSERLQLRQLRHFQGVVGVSTGIVERVRAAGVPASNIHHIANAWDGRPTLSRAEARQRLGLPADAFVAGWVGRLSLEKGADVFLDALALCDRAGMVACVLGDGRERQALQRRATVLGVDDIVQWKGVRDDAGSLMKAFDVLVLSSRTEGVPITLLEALHAGTPVIATAVGGIPSVVDSTLAILVGAENPRALAEAIATTRRAPHEAQGRAGRAQQHLSTQFGIAPWLERYSTVYGLAMNNYRAQGTGQPGTMRPSPQ